MPHCGYTFYIVARPSCKTNREDGGVELKEEEEGEEKEKEKNTKKANTDKRRMETRILLHSSTRRVNLAVGEKVREKKGGEGWGNEEREKCKTVKR